MKPAHVERSYRLAREAYAACGVDTDAALARLAKVPVSMQCWQGDDVRGFEHAGSLADGGLMATGNYPGCARTASELRQDMEKALSLVPGKHRVNLHAIYAETGGRRVQRDELEFAHFNAWTAWARAQGLGIDFNPTFFAHPMAASGYTLSHTDKAVRAFWIRHGIACRRIAARIGRELKKPCITNVWVPDGSKDMPADRAVPRLRLEESLDEIFELEISPAHNLDAVESKLFGIGSESYVVGSHEFYLGYAVKNSKVLCLDTGHFHPTETVADKLSAALVYLDDVLLHISRGVRWDSDHVVVLSDDVKAIMEEVVRGGYLERVHIGLDYFDASINRVAAWVIGMRAVLKALLIALLEPTARLRAAEQAGDLTARLALMEEAKSLPFAAVWDYYCLSKDTPVGADWMRDVKRYEKDVLSGRN